MHFYILFQASLGSFGQKWGLGGGKKDEKREEEDKGKRELEGEEKGRREKKEKSNNSVLILRRAPVGGVLLDPRSAGLLAEVFAEEPIPQGMAV